MEKDIKSRFAGKIVENEKINCNENFNLRSPQVVTRKYSRAFRDKS